MGGNCRPHRASQHYIRRAVPVGAAAAVPVASAVVFSTPTVYSLTDVAAG